MEECGGYKYESGETTEEDDVTGVGRGESATDWDEVDGVKQGWFQRQGESYRNEQSVTLNEDNVRGQARMTRDEERVLRAG